MRIDKYLFLIGILKSRTVAKKACEKGYVFINERKVKGSVEVKEGDIIFLDFPLRSIKIKVKKVPDKKSISKKERGDYFEILSDERKEII
ncbi:MAG: S4 domain-containing protein [candidate division WOR-3 bacterium]